MNGRLLIFALSEIIFTYSLFALYSIFISQPSKKKWKLYLVAFIFWSLQVFMYLNPTANQNRFFINVGIDIFIVSYFFEGSIKRKALAVILVNMLFILLEMIFYGFFSIDTSVMEMYFLLQMLILLTIIFILKKKAKLTWGEVPRKYTLIFISLPLLSVLLVMKFIIERPENGQFGGEYLFTYSILLIMNIGLIFLYEGIGKYMEEAREKEAIKSQRDNLERLLEERQRSQEETSKFRHEYINQVDMLVYCLEEGKVSLAKERLEDLSSQLKKTSYPLHLGDPLLDQFLEGQLEELRALEADIDLDLDILAPMGDLNFPLYTILENLIKNAIEALEKSEEKIFSLNVSKEREIHILVKNSFSKKPLIKGGRYIRQDGNPNRGLGLSIVQSEVDKIGGKMDISTEEDIFVVDIKIAVKTGQG